MCEKQKNSNSWKRQLILFVLSILLLAICAMLNFDTNISSLMKDLSSSTFIICVLISAVGVEIGVRAKYKGDTSLFLICIFYCFVPCILISIVEWADIGKLSDVSSMMISIIIGTRIAALSNHIFPIDLTADKEEKK